MDERITSSGEETERRGMSPIVPDSLGTTGLKLMGGGALVGVTVSLIGAGLVSWLIGGSAGLGFLTGTLAGLATMSLGQGLLTAVRKRAAVVMLVIALGAYAVAGLGVIGLLVWVKTQGNMPMLWVGVGILVAANAYLVGAIWSFRRLRLLLFTPNMNDIAPKVTQDGQCSCGNVPTHPPDLRE